MGTLAVLALLLGASCSAGPSGTLARARARGFLRAGYAYEPPYAYLDSGGTVTGESPEALEAILPALGVRAVRWLRLDFDELLPALRDGRVDVVASGMFPTPERRRVARFSVSTICARAALVTRPGQLDSADLRDFAGAGRTRVAVLAGAVEQRAAEEVGVPSDRLVPVQSLQTALAAVASGSADAFAITAPTAKYAVEHERGAPLAWHAYVPAPRIRGLVQGCSALAFRRGDVRLAALADSALRPFVGSGRHWRALERLGLSREAWVQPPGPGGR